MNKPLKVVNLSQAKAGLSEIIGDVAHKKECTIIRRRGKDVAVIVPYEEYLQSSLAGKKGLSQAIGACPGLDSAIEELVEAVYSSREQAQDRDISF